MLRGSVIDHLTMNLRIKLRLIGLALGIGLMGLVIVFETIQSQRQAQELHAQLNLVDSESFRIADQFREFLRELNGSMYRYGIDRDPTERDGFLKSSQALHLWIDEQKPKLTSDQEKALMQQIDAAYDDYLRAAGELLTKFQSLGEQRATMTDYVGLRKESERLFDLGQSLAKAHYQSRGVVVARANRSIKELRALVLVSLACLFVLGVVLAVIVYRDMITPLRVKLVQSQALMDRQEKLASLGMLAAGVAHEIRNPLTAIKAALFIQQKNFEPGTQEFLDVKIVEREILRLENVVNEFLLFARPTEPQLVTIAADAPLREVQTLLTPQLTASNIQLVLEESPPLRIKADAAQIKQVLINLVQNAADAIGKNGLVKLRARQDRKRIANVETNVVVLEVTDNGKGIPPEVQQRLFDPFFTTKETGTGLGLSIAVGIVHRHGGALQYQTQVDYGTTFGIILPQTTE
jgi:signal transduction histidine kinase